jgi:ATP synthase protein I
MVTRASSGDSNSTSSSGEQADPQAAKSADVTRALPNKGYFSLADPNAEVYSKAGEKFDPTKKPGRYKPEFIWNTNWQETLKIQEQLEQQRKDYEAKKAAGEIVEDEGFLNMSRLQALDDMDVDLTPLLLKKREPLYKPATPPAEPKPKPKKQQRKMSSDLPTGESATGPSRP